MIFNFGLIIFIFTIIVGCSPFNHQPPDYEKMADEITEATARKLKLENNFSLVGTGGGMMDDIQMMAMSFHYYQEVDLTTGRELLVYVINEYLSAINGNENIKHYLHNYPFTVKNIEIRIWIFKPDGTRPPLDKIEYFSAINGKLTYYLDLPPYSSQVICKEAFAEAQQIVLLKKDI